MQHALLNTLFHDLTFRRGGLLDRIKDSTLFMAWEEDQRRGPDGFFTSSIYGEFVWVSRNLQQYSVF